MISFVPKEPSDPRTDRDPVTSKCGWVVIFAKAGTLSVLFNAPEITNSNFPIFCFLLSHEQQISSAPVTRLRFTFSVTKKTVSEHGSPTGPSRSRKARIERSFHKLVFPRYRTQRNETTQNRTVQNKTKNDGSVSNPTGGCGDDGGRRRDDASSPRSGRWEPRWRRISLLSLLSPQQLVPPPIEQQRRVVLVHLDLDPLPDERLQR